MTWVLFLCLLPNLVGGWAHGMFDYMNTPSPEIYRLKLIYVFLLAALGLNVLILAVSFTRGGLVPAATVTLLGILSLTETVYRLSFGQVTDANFWTIVWNSTLYESKAYLLGSLSSLALFGVGLVFAGVGTALALKNVRPVAPRRLRGLIYTLVLLATFIFLTGQTILPTEPGGTIAQFDGPTEAALYVFPYNLGMAYREHRIQDHAVKTILRERESYDPNVKKNFAGPDLVVLVIGESSTATHWSLSGYPRPTNPELAKRSDLVFFRQAYSLADNTLAAVPGLLRLATSETLKIFYPEASLISGFKKLGYHTAWYSLQAKMGAFDDAIGLLSAEADEEHYLSVASFHAQSSFDEELLVGLTQALGEKKPQFLILHTLGSHVAYQHRYPPAFELFRPVPAPNDWGHMFRPDPAERERLINAYDNSVAYTDHLLAKIILALETSGRNALFAFASDHGQGLLEGGCLMFAHDPSCPPAYHVPLVFWASDAYRQSQTEVWRQLGQNAKTPVSMFGFAMTLFDLAGAKYAGRIEKYVWSRHAARGLHTPALTFKGDLVPLSKDYSGH